ncbi:MAG TPA: glycosyltransferase family 39 protein, partial [Anaerolineae bacterium]
MSQTYREPVGLERPLIRGKTATVLLDLVRSETFTLVLLVAAALFLAFYNLGLNPRPWNDEGAYLSLAKTLAKDGVYAVRTSAGYETFGAVQSVGPTLIVPIGLSFRLLGTGLVQGRLVTSSLLVLTLIAFYFCGRLLFGRRAAIFAAFLLVASPASGYLAYGRSALGDIPALGFFLTGWFLWVQGRRRQRNWLFVLAGLLVGAAMVTKSQYVLVGIPTLGLVAVLDLIYYRQRNFPSLVVVGAIALACFAAFWAWQVAYFGPATFQENAVKAAQLAAATKGLTGEAIKTLIGPSSGYFYFYWGFAALLYAGLISSRRTKDAVPSAFLWIFAILWLACYLVLFVPTTRYSLAAAAITALFVGKLAGDLLSGLSNSWRSVWQDLRPAVVSRARGSTVPLALGTLVALLTLGLLTAFQLQRTVR